ncbi:MAG: hypothetical protein WBA74_07575 [Cyclobacteriaceae bacterium]
MTIIEEILKYLTVIGLSTFKFVGGPLSGISFGFNIVVTSLLTFTGMMISVVAFTGFNKPIQAFTKKYLRRKDRKVFSSKSRRFVTIWNKYGLKGVAFLTPILLTPIGGTVLANTFSDDKEKIIRFMAISGFFWSFVITTILYYFGHLLSSFLPV